MTVECYLTRTLLGERVLFAPSRFIAISQYEKLRDSDRSTDNGVEVTSCVAVSTPK